VPLASRVAPSGSLASSRTMAGTSWRRARRNRSLPSLMVGQQSTVAGQAPAGVQPWAISGSIIMMFDSPFPIATPGLLRLYVEDAGAVVRRAVAAGGTVVTRAVGAWAATDPPLVPFWGEAPDLFNQRP
jgi:hypothetical protein